MNKSGIFKLAHARAKKSVAIVGDYQIAFTFELRGIYKQLAENAKRVVYNVPEYYAGVLFLIVSVVFLICGIEIMKALINYSVIAMIFYTILATAFFAAAVMMYSGADEKFVSATTQPTVKY